MAIELSPKGTRGTEFPKAARWIIRALLPRFQATRQGTWLVVATALGSARHPVWYLNLANHSDDVWVEVDHRRLQVRAESLTGLERDEAWRRIVAAAPRFGAYEQQTDRVIPVVRLIPTE
jgi:deazaflavin-dependent oxidoreductase (nitroreductase family)